MIAMIEKQRKQMYNEMDGFIAKKQKRKQEWFRLSINFDTLDNSLQPHWTARNCNNKWWFEEYALPTADNKRLTRHRRAKNIPRKTQNILLIKRLEYNIDDFGMKTVFNSA